MFGGGGQLSGPITNLTISDAEPTKIVLTFTGNVSASDAKLDWTYSVDGGVDTVFSTGVISGNTLTLTMATPAVFGQVITLSYSDVASDFAVNNGVADYEPSWISNFNLPAQDAQGWTVPTIDSTANVVYVSNAGDDTLAAASGQYAYNAFADMFNPVGEQAYATFEAAIDNMGFHKADVVLFKRGDEFDLTSGANIEGGLSTTKRALISNYGTGALPILNATPATERMLKFFREWGFTNIIGLDFTANTRDNTHVDFEGIGSISSDPIGIASYNAANVLDDVMDGILIEGCTFRNLIIGTDLATNGLLGVHSTDRIVRRNTFYNQYKSSTGGHAQGLNMGMGQYLVEENLFVENGFNAADPTGSGAPTIFSHSIYSRSVDGSIYRNNTSYNPSSIHFKFTSEIAGVATSTNISVYGNVFIDGEVTVSIGGNLDGQGLRFANTYVQGNVAIAIGKSQNTGRDLGWGWNVVDTDFNITEDNYFLHTDNVATIDTYAASVDWNANDVTVRNNHSFDANGAVHKTTPFTGTQTGGGIYGNGEGLLSAVYVDSARTIESYMTSLGQTATLDAFADKLKLQNIDNWQASYTTNTLPYLKAGYVLVDSILLLSDLASTTYSGGAYSVPVNTLSSSATTFEWKVDGVVDGTNTEQVYVGTGLSGNFTLQCTATANSETVVTSVATITEFVASSELTLKSSPASHLTFTQMDIGRSSVVAATFKLLSGSAATIFGHSGHGARQITISSTTMRFRFGGKNETYTIPTVADLAFHTFSFTTDASGVGSLVYDTVTISPDVASSATGEDPFDAINNYAYASPTNIIVKDVTLKGYTDPEVQYAIDSEFVTGGTEAASVGTGTLTGQGSVLIGDWS